MGKAYEETVVQLRVEKIQQKLFWYDNLPPDREIASLVKEWRELKRCLSKLADRNSK